MVSLLDYLSRFKGDKTNMSELEYDMETLNSRDYSYNNQLRDGAGRLRRESGDHVRADLPRGISSSRPLFPARASR